MFLRFFKWKMDGKWEMENGKRIHHPCVLLVLGSRGEVAKRPSETELCTEQVRSRRKVALIPNSRIKVLHKSWSAHKNPSHVIFN